MERLFSWKVFFIVSGLISCLILCIGFSSLLIPAPLEFVLTKKQNILIFAAHQDDGVISAGGLAIQNDSLKGKTHVVYITQPDSPIEKVTRYQEALDVWSMLPNKSATTEFWGMTGKQFVNQGFEKSLQEKIRSKVYSLQPDIVIFPLLEGGNYHHDILAKAGKKIEADFEAINFRFAAEYNSSYIMSNAPQKLVWFMVRMLPVVSFKAPNYGLDPRNQEKLAMSYEELELKKKMLLGFRSQQFVIPLYQFGYEDLFDNSNLSNYKLYNVLNKKMSFASILFLVLTFSYTAYLGAFVMYKQKQIKEQIAISLFLLIPAILGFNNPILLKEELIFVFVVTIGALIVFAINIINIFLDSKFNR